jgi:hypothetical protein
MSPVTASGPAGRRRVLAGFGLALAAVLGTTACGEQQPSSAAAQAAGGTAGTADDAGTTSTESLPVVRLDKGADKPRLRCSSDERSVMIADFAMGAKGEATPQDAVGLSSLEEGEQMVVGPGGTTVWILRSDGTAREEIDLIRSRGWLLHMREACA